MTTADKLIRILAKCSRDAKNFMEVGLAMHNETVLMAKTLEHCIEHKDEANMDKMLKIILEGCPELAEAFAVNTTVN